MENSKHGIITPQCVDKMLSNSTFLETRIQGLLDGLIFVEKKLGVHVQRILKISMIYTLAVILSKIFVKKKRRLIGDLINDHGLTMLRFGVNLIFIKIYYADTACTTYTFKFGKC